MQPTHHPGPLSDQVVVTIGQQGQHGAVVLHYDVAQVGVAQGHDGGGPSVVGVGLGAAAPVQELHPGRQRGRHIDDLLAYGHQLAGQQGTGAGGTFDGPAPGRERLRPLEEALQLLGIGIDAHLGHHLLRAAQGCGGVRSLVWVHSDDEHGAPPLVASGFTGGGQS